MDPKKFRQWAMVFAALFAFAAAAWAVGEKEILELGTYVTGPIDRLVANRMTVGSAYRPEVIANSAVPDGTLLISRNFGVRAAPPRSNPPNGVTTGNLDANDVYVRHTSVRRWLGQPAADTNGSHMAAGRNAAAISVPANGPEVSLVSVSITTFGRSVLAWGRVSASFPFTQIDQNPAMTVRLYRDGIIVDQVTVFAGNFVVVTATATLAAGNHTFQLRAQGSNNSGNGTITAGGARLTAIEI